MERTFPAVLDDFLSANREAIVTRARARVASRANPMPTDVELTNGIPVFLDQLGDALRLAKSDGAADHDQLGVSAGRHGSDLFRMGLTIGQVVHDYGDVCQVITEMAVQQGTPISGEEFRLLNLCLDDAIAGAVTEYARQREHAIKDEGNERLGFLAHELRNLLNVGMIAFEHIKSGRVAIGGSTGGVLGRSLVDLRNLIDRSLAEVLLDAGIERIERISVAEFIEEVEIGATMQAESRGLHFTATHVDRVVTIEGDRQILLATVSNLLQNAFKFSRRSGTVMLTTEVTPGRVLFHVEDECGGLPPGKAEELFRPFEQRGTDRTGIGLGLSICLKAAKATAATFAFETCRARGACSRWTFRGSHHHPCPSSVATTGRPAHPEPRVALTAQGWRTPEPKQSSERSGPADLSKFC